MQFSLYDLILVLVLVLGAIFAYFYLEHEKKYEFFINNALSENSNKRIPFEIKKGENVKNIANNLESKEIIFPGSSWAFYRYAKEQGGEQIQAGNFILSPSKKIPEIFETLKTGESEEFPLTILEGWTIKGIDKALSSKGLISGGEFIATVRDEVFDFDFLKNSEVSSLEGYFFPDTYFVNKKTFTVKGFAQRMLNNFDNKFNEQMRKDAEEKGKTVHEIATMASIIEREERNPAERAIVSGILWKRLKNGIPLGADATILYALGDWKAVLTNKELQMETPYNTRKYLGLPPTPICTFSLSSLKAALYPEESDYFYYLHDSEGKIHYARTNDEHNQNKRKYL